METLEFSFVFSAIVSVLLTISEALSLIPGIKSNGLFQLALSILRRLGKKKSGRFDGTLPK